MAGKIKALFLDIGGVLLTDGWGRRQRQAAIDHFGLEEDDFTDRNGLIWPTYESDLLTLDDYLDYVIFHKKRDFSREEFRSFMFAQSTPLDGAIDYFKSLKKERGYKVVALSNEARELNAYRIETFKLNELFDYYISSCYVGMRKPDPDMYKLAFDTAQVRPDEGVYIDDRITYIEMASARGIQSLHYTGIDSATDYFKNI
jgi:putative hydrolase of the HAD superfamily